MPNMVDLLTIKNHLPGYKHHWIYIDNGMPVMVVSRYEEEGKKTYRQFRQKNDEWIEGMPPFPYPLFGLNTLKNFSPMHALFITEGEKCASILHQLGWPALSTVLGAQNPSKTDWHPLRYYNRIIILRDNDKAGITFTQQVAIEIRRIVPHSEIFVVNLTPTIPGGDVENWLQSTILRGQDWNGYKPIPENILKAASKALISEIQNNLKKVEECPAVAYKPIEALFEGKPRQLKMELRPVPPFPLHVLPDKVSTFLKLTSEQFSQVPDYAATTFFVSLSGLIGRSVHLSMRAGSSWIETANAWAVLVGEPSAKKSPIMRRIFNLFKNLEKQAVEDFAQAQKIYKAKKRDADKADTDCDELPPIRRRYITDDVTIPKLRELMAGNPRGIILRNDELKGQMERLDKFGSEGDRSFMMSCWSGLEEYSEDRMCRESLLNVPLALTWIGCIPPTALQRYLREAMGRGSGSDGFMQRFQFVCFPDQKKNFELPSESVPLELEKEIQDIWKQIDDDARGKGRVLAFNDYAQKRFDQWLIYHENYARFGGHPVYWESHLGKQAKALAVIVIFLHRLQEVAEKRTSEKVTLETLVAALEILSYYEEHALRSYESIIGGTVADAENILMLLKQQRLPTRFKAQDIYHQGLGGLSDSARVRAALEMLEDFGWVVSEKVAGKTGRQAEFWVLHPRAFDKS